MFQSANTCVEFCEEFRAFFAFVSQLLIEYIPKLPFFVFGKFGQLFEDFVETHLYLNFILIGPF